MQQAQFGAHGVRSTVDSAATTMGEVNRTKDVEAIRALDTLREILSVSREARSWSAGLTTEEMLARL